MIPKKYSHLLQISIVSFMMSCVMSFCITLLNIGFPDGFFAIWLRAWITAWAIALPTLMTIFPFVRKIVAFLTKDHQ